jgi:hypothetical protein
MEVGRDADQRRETDVDLRGIGACASHHPRFVEPRPMAHAATSSTLA